MHGSFMAGYGWLWLGWPEGRLGGDEPWAAADPDPSMLGEGDGRGASFLPTTARRSATRSGL